jgi:glycosyltransferase involved in cell wall biosynthesis/mannosyltransferase OCH1-like enzyme
MRGTASMNILRELCIENNLKDKVMIEIGCYSGESTSSFADVCGKVYAIDPWVEGVSLTDGAVRKSGPAWVHPNVEEAFDKRMGSYLNVKKIKAFDYEVVDNFEDESVDFIYIDALHTEEQLKRQIDMWLPKIKPDGIIGGHDYNTNFQGIMNAVNCQLGSPEKVYNDAGNSWIKHKSSIKNKKTIPLHFIVSGKDFDYLYYASILTAVKTQKTTSTIIWVTGNVDSPYFDILKEKFEILKTPNVDFPALKGKPDYFVGAHLKDYFAYRFLYNYGGICMDLDTISVSDIVDLMGKEDALVPMYKKIDGDSKKYLNSAILGGKRKSSFYKEAMDLAFEKLQIAPKDFIWGDTGPTLVSDVATNHMKNVVIPSLLSCGGRPDYDVKYVYNENSETKLDSEVKIIHLYAVASNSQGNLFNNVSLETIINGKSLLARTIKSILPENEWNPFLEKSYMFSRFPLNYLVTGNEFGYPYYLSALTGIKTQKTTSTNIWITSEIQNREYLDILQEKYNVNIIKIENEEIFYAFTGKDEYFKNANIKDYLSYKILYEAGGVYFDLDTISISDVTDLLGNKEMVIPLDDNLIDDKIYHHNGAVQIAKKRSPAIQDALETSLMLLRTTPPELYNWGKGGPNLLSEVIVRHKDDVNVPDFGVCSAYGWREASSGKILEFFADNTNIELDPKARLVHMFAGQINKAGGYFNRISPEVVSNENSLFSRTIKSILKKEEWNPFEGDNVRVRKNSIILPSTTKTKFRFHLIGYTHLPCSKDFFACAFTAKNYNMSQMLLDLGHEVFYYGAESSTVPCTEFIQTHSLRDIQNTWGEGNNLSPIGYDWKSNQFKHDFNTSRTPLTLKFYDKCAEEINKRKRPDDFLMIAQGYYHKPIADKVQLYKNLEFGIGYRGSVKGYFRGFESLGIQQFTYGSENPFKSINGAYYDRVFGNYFNPDDFEYGNDSEDYYLYLGRMIHRKGVMTAVKATQAIGAKLILAGQKDPEINEKTLPINCEFVGHVDIEQRKKLMSKAIATFTPTLYLEPFCGVHCESMLSSVPPITTNFGVFPETIPDYLDGKVGFRCNTLQDFVDAALKAKSFTKKDRAFVRKYGEKFLTTNVSAKYQKWFEDIHQLYLSTLDSNVKGWHYLSDKITK